MPHSVFGWSYPPGCSGTPYDEDYPCDICGNFPENCICPECPVCGEYGNPKCYEEHGLTLTAEQIDNQAIRLRELEEEKRDMELYAAELEEERIREMGHTKHQPEEI